MKKIAFLFLFCIPTLQAQNFIKNGNFEDGLQNWSGYNNQVLTDADTNSKVGNVNNGEGSLYQVFTVQPNTTYKFYFDYKWVSGSGNYNMTVRVKTGATNGNDLETLTLATAADIWHQATINFTTGSSDSEIRVVFYKTNGNRPLRIDNVAVYDANFTPSFVDAATPLNVQPNGVPGNWVLEFSDEFNGTSLNTNKWYKSVSATSRAPRPDLGISDWWWKAENVLLENGNLVLRAIKHDQNTMYCGSVESRGLYEVQYGYLEARIKIAKTAKGNHTAFWLQGENQGNIDNSAADGAEVDIFESAWTSNTTKAVVHYDGYGANKKNHTIPFNVPNLHNDDFHTFGLLWTANEMYIYYDGVRVTSTQASKPFPFSTDPVTGYKLVPNVKEWLWLSVGASFADGDFLSQPTGILSDALVDYVRVYKPSTTLSLENFNIKDEIIVYPNPIKDKLFIKTPFSEYKLLITNSIGAIVYEKNINDSNAGVYTSNFSNGLYFVHIKHKNQSYIKKIII